MKSKLLAGGMALCFLGGCGSQEPDCASGATINLVKEILKEHPVNEQINKIFNESEQYANVLATAFVPRNYVESSEIKHMNEQLEKAKAQLENEKTAYGKAYERCRYEQADPNACGTSLERLFNKSGAYDYHYPNNPFNTDRGIALARQKLDTAVNNIVGLDNELRSARWKETYEFRNEELRRKQAEQDETRSKLMSAWEEAQKKITYNLDTIRTMSKNNETKAVACRAKLTIRVPDWGSAETQTNYTAQYTSEGELYVEIQSFL